MTFCLLNLQNNVCSCRAGVSRSKKERFLCDKKNIFKQCYWTKKLGDILFSKNDTIFFLEEIKILNKLK